MRPDRVIAAMLAQPRPLNEYLLLREALEPALMMLEPANWSEWIDVEISEGWRKPVQPVKRRRKKKEASQ